jgi:hypothetical protein
MEKKYLLQLVRRGGTGHSAFMMIECTADFTARSVSIRREATQ